MNIVEKEIFFKKCTFLFFISRFYIQLYIRTLEKVIFLYCFFGCLLYFLYLCSVFQKYNYMNVVGVIHKYGFTVKEVSKLLGKHEKTLDVMIAKSRDTNSMQVATLRKIADVLGCSIGEFFDDEPITKNGIVVQPPAPEDKGRLVLDINGAIARSGLQKQEVAQKIGVTTVAFSVMLKNGNPTYQRMCEIADALGITIFDLFTYEEEEKGKKKRK